MIKKITLLSFVILTAVLVSPSYAQDNNGKEPPQSVVRQEKTDNKTAQKNTPITKWIEAENALINPLSDADKESIFILRQKHSIIRVIGVVERDIEQAVKSCAKANPDMKDKIEARFDQWKNAVKPVVDTAQKNLKTEIDKQEIVDSDEFKKVLKLNDRAFEHSDKMTVKNPVSSKNACEKLIASMDKTEDDMIKLLQDTLLPPSVIKSRLDRVEKTSGEKKKSFSKDTQ